MKRRTFTSLVASTLPIFACRNALASVKFPQKPVQILVPYAPGGATDSVARSLGEQLAKTWKVPVIVENRPGGSTSIAVRAMSMAPKDGHTLLLTTGSTATLIPHTLKVPFDSAAELHPVAQVARTPLFLFANPNVPASDLPGFIAWVKRNPQKATYGSYGAGTAGHFGGLILNQAAGVEMTHVPYQGGAPALQSLVGGHIDLLIDAYLPAMQQVKAGKALVLAVSSPERSPYAPNVPTFRELGYPQMERISGFFGLFAARGVDAGIVDSINKTVRAALATPELAERFTTLGLLAPHQLSPVDFNRQVQDENSSWAKFVQQIGFKRGEI